MRILVSGSLKMVQDMARRYPRHVGLITTPRNGNGITALAKTGLPWGFDNGAFSGFDPALFRRRLRLAVGQPGLLWVVCPDSVADARTTLRLFDEWEPELQQARLPVAFVGQDGQEDLPVPWDRFDCFFVGGTTKWKLSIAAADLMDAAKQRGKWIHVGRVNSLRRLRMAWDRGADSVDGSSYSRWRHKSTMRPDMSLERHLRFVSQLERQRVLFAEDRPLR